ncbi:MFS transporter [Desulfotomaculum nigrificans]|uniref:MFS transporter n=1 Tax=Desulfotomaculum nigrificans TaxID=1565 RepID=UPI0001FAEC7E|nr:MFS transporter [Desulfotomaculum nigrificans]
MSSRMGSNGNITTGYLDKPVMARRSRVRFLILTTLFITLLVAYLDRVNISVLIADPQFLAEMNLQQQATKQGLLMTVFLIAYGLANMSLGFVGDKIGPRKAMSLSIVSWTVACFLGGWARNFTTMLSTRVLLGVGEGFHWPMQSTFVKNWFPAHERGRANAAWLMGLMVGPTLAMPILASIISNHGWRSSFFFLGVLGLLLPLPLIWFLTADRPEQHRMTNEAEIRYIQEGAMEPVKVKFGANPYKEVLSSGAFWLTAIGYTAAASIFWGVMTWLPQYLRVARHFSWSQMGYLSALPFILGGISLVVSGFISDKMLRRAPLCCLGFLGAVAFLYLGATSSSNLASAIFMALSIAFVELVQPNIWTIVQSMLSADLVGTGAGLLNGIANFISALAPMAIGFLISLTGSYFGGLVYLMVIGLMGAVASAVLVIKKY